MPTIASIMLAWSTQVFWRSAARMPLARPKMMVRMSE